MSIGFLPKPKDFFPNENYSSLIEVMRNCDSNFVLTVLSKINAFLFFQDNSNRQEILLLEIIQEVDTNERNRIIDCYRILTNKVGLENLSIFSLYASMRVISFCVRNYSNNNTLDNNRQILQVFKAILLVNREVDDIHGQNKSTDIYDLILPAILPQTEYAQTKRIDTELYHSFGVLEYLISTYPEYVPSFKSKFELEIPQQYIYKVLISVFGQRESKTQKYKCVYQVDEEVNYNEFWIQDLSDQNNIEEEVIIKHLREKPILRFNDGTYCIPNFNFLIDKFRNGLLFDFYYGSGLNSDILFKDFKNDFGDNYSEKQLFYGLMDEMVRDHPNIKMLKSNQDIGHDFDLYLRIDNKILLFEFKDYLMNDKTKNSGVEKIQKYINEHFVSNERSRPKGVTQLINVINQLKDNVNCFEDIESCGIDKKRLIIFPIIVFSDKAFSIPVLNQHLSSIFKSQMGTQHGNFYMVYNPVMIHINTIIEQIDFLKIKSSNILKLLIDYKQYLGYRNLILRQDKNANNLLLAVSSFDDYISSKKDLLVGWHESYAFNESKKKLEQFGLMKK